MSVQLAGSAGLPIVAASMPENRTTGWGAASRDVQLEGRRQMCSEPGDEAHPTVDQGRPPALLDSLIRVDAGASAANVERPGPKRHRWIESPLAPEDGADLQQPERLGDVGGAERGRDPRSRSKPANVRRANRGAATGSDGVPSA